jgi:hypothetical protein
MSNTIVCPNCKSEFEISAVMAAQLEADIRARLEAELAPRRKQLEAQAASMAAQQAALEQARAAIEEQVRQKLAAERNQLVEQARAKARQELSLELSDRDQQLREAQAKLSEFRKTELELRLRERALHAAREELELSINRRLDEERAKVRLDALRRAAEEHQLKDVEKDRKIADLARQLDEAKRRLEQGSQQAQGEVLELVLEDLLRETFPHDSIEEVGKGRAGGDVIQRVRTPAGADCGAMLWESKRTRNWSDGWLAKLRQDQREAKAAVAILVTTALPPAMEHFGHLNGIWICTWPCAMAVAMALRAGLLEAAAARRAHENRHDKMEQVYAYLVSPEFHNRIGGIVEAFATMRDDLEAEKRAFQKHWAKREKQLERALTCTAGMYGDFQGIIGATLPEIEQMDLLQLDACAAERALSADGA